MASLAEIVSWLDEELRIDSIPDYPGALNGLQVERSGPVERVVAAVDASLPVVEMAVHAEADLLIVHHGLFWSGAQKVTGAFYRKLKAALESGLAIYSAHIPLDIHPRLGNNARLAEEIGLVDCENFFEWKGVLLGKRGLFPGSVQELATRCESVMGAKPHLCPGGGDQAGSVGVITGGAGGEVAKVAGTGVDTFLTGEGPHWSYVAAEELGINVLYGGHYATETFGVKAAAAEIAERFGVSWSFLDHPTGL